MTPAFIGIGGRIEASAMKIADVVAAMVQLMADSAAPSVSLRSNTAWSPAIVSVSRTVFGSPLSTS